MVQNYPCNLTWQWHGNDSHVFLEDSSLEDVQISTMSMCWMVVVITGKSLVMQLLQLWCLCHSWKKYFTSSDPHHDFYRFVTGKSSGILSDISFYLAFFWHSIRHSIWHIFWHRFWYIFWHVFWHILWQSIWHFIWHSIWHTFSHSIWHIFWHSIWHIFWPSIRRWGPAVHTELGRSPVEVQRYTLRWANPKLRSSGAHWAGQVPGWGPAVHTELRRSLVEVQRCTLSLRSSGAHWAGQVPGWGPSDSELGSWQRAWRRELAKSLAKSWQGGSGGGSWCRHGRGETRGGGGGGRGGGGGGQLAEEEEEEEENSSDKI